MEYYGNKLCISARELVDSSVMSQGCYQKMATRGRIDVVRRGDVNRAKLYYLRDKIGKAAKIKEKSFR